MGVMLPVVLLFAAAVFAQHPPVREAARDWKISHELGLAATKLGKLEEAEKHYREALKLNPGFIPARKNLAVVLWFLGRKAESEREFQGLLKEIPADPVPHLYLGLAAQERRQFVEAAEHFEKVGDLALNNPEVLPAVLTSYLGAAAAYDRLGIPEKAHAAYLRAIEAEPRSEDAYLALAQFSAAHKNN